MWSSVLLAATHFQVKGSIPVLEGQWEVKKANIGHGYYCRGEIGVEIHLTAPLDPKPLPDATPNIQRTARFVAKQHPAAVFPGALLGNFCFHCFRLHVMEPLNAMACTTPRRLIEHLRATPSGEPRTG